MTTKTKMFTSAMPGAPVLSGTAGALLSVLDACLVDGYGLQTATSVVIAGGVATVTLPAAPATMVDSVALIAGATPGGLNGEQRITAVTATTASFASALADQTASGSITFKVAPAGWSKPFSGTSLAAYKSLAVTGTGCMLKVDDTATTTARVRGFEAMSDIVTGTGPFPTLGQWGEPGLWWSKSDSASATARPWIIVADDRGLFYFVKNADASAHYQGNYFGDILSLKSNDPYACVLRANAMDHSNHGYALTDSLSHGDTGQSYNGLYAARAANTLTRSIKCYQAPVMNAGVGLGNPTGYQGWLYPSPVDNGLMLTPVCIYAADGYRGYYPGLMYSPQQTNSAFATGDVVNGSGALAGKKVVVINLGSLATPYERGTVFVDHTSDWR